MILCNFVSLRAFTPYMENSLRFEISLWSIWLKWNLHRSEFHSTEVMWTLLMKLPYTEVKFYPEVKSQTSLSSLRVSCKHAFLISANNLFINTWKIRVIEIKDQVIFKTEQNQKQPPWSVLNTSPTPPPGCFWKL